MDSSFPRILVVDLGSQYTQLIARRLREFNVYAEIVLPEDVERCLTSKGVYGLVLSGSPYSVYDSDVPALGEGVVGRVPVLGICFGAQWLAHRFGGEVVRSERREFGPAYIREVEGSDPLLGWVRVPWRVWMSHSDTIRSLPSGWEALAYTSEGVLAVFRGEVGGVPVYGVQFHPEVSHTEDGQLLLYHFARDLCGCPAVWTPEHFVDRAVRMIRERVPEDEEVVMALSGGVDSTVAAVLIHRAVGKRFHGIFVDTGLMRKNEAEEVLSALRGLGLPVVRVDASDRFFGALRGVVDPEEKRRRIGEVFIRVFEEATRGLERVRWLGQGTIYPDVIESAGTRYARKIKSHHNVGGLPDRLPFRLIEPLRELFKDEVRRVGEYLGIPEALLMRHPFPGPGLAIRVVGEVTPEKVRLVREADAIFIQVLKEEGYYDQVWQAGAILLPIRTVGVMGDVRTYEYAVCLRAVVSRDGMTADWARLPYGLLEKVARRIVNEVSGINRVVYDLTSKPPGTIEWE